MSSATEKPLPRVISTTPDVHYRIQTLLAAIRRDSTEHPF
jgi:hypothetical protein